jgi:hypothetical protein
MNIAYLVLAHNNFQQLNRLIKSLMDDNSDLFIHFDKKSIVDTTKFNFDNVFILENRYSINWGGFSMIQAEMELLKTAKANKDYDYYILLSGDSYPIKRNTEINKYLEINNGSNFIDCRRIPLEVKKERINKYFIEGGYRNNSPKANIIRISNKLLSIIIAKRKIPSQYSKYQLYWGSQWWALHKDFVSYLFSFYSNNEKFVSFFKNTLIPDEMFYQIIIMNSSLKGTVKYPLTYVDWYIGEPPYPSLMGEKHLEILLQDIIQTKNGSGYQCFARKFNDYSETIIKKIEEMKNKKVECIKMPQEEKTS